MVVAEVIVFTGIFFRVAFFLFINIVTSNVYAGWVKHDIPSVLRKDMSAKFLVKEKKRKLTSFEGTKECLEAKELIKRFTFAGDPSAASIYIEGKLKGKFGFKRLDEANRMLFLEIFALKGYAKARHYIFRGLFRGEHGFEENTELAWNRLQRWKEKGDASIVCRYNPEYETELKNSKHRRLLALKVDLLENHQAPIVKKLFDTVLCASFEDIDNALKELRHNKRKFATLQAEVAKSNNEEDKAAFESLTYYKDTVAVVKYDISVPYAQNRVKLAQKRVLRYLDFL